MMPQKRVNYGRMYKKDQEQHRECESEEPRDSVYEETVIEENPHCKYRKKVPSKIRIRKGPGLDFGHNGKYVNVDEVTIAKVENGFGLLADYEKSNNGWVSLEYFEPID